MFGVADEDDDGSEDEGVDDGEGEGEEVDGEAPEDDADEDDLNEGETDLQLAWENLDLARIIYERQPKRSIEEVDVITALADISLEKGICPLYCSLSSEGCRPLSVLTSD